MVFHRIKNRRSPELRLYPEHPQKLDSLPKEFLTPLAVTYLRQTVRDGGAIVTLRKGSQYLSLGIMKYVGDDLCLTHLETLPQHRHQGYAGELLHRLLAVSDRRKRVDSHVNVSYESYPYMKRLLLKEGFQYLYRYTTFVASMEDILNCGGIERLDKRLARTLEEGFSMVSFQEADPDLLEQVRHSKTNGFQNTLDPNGLFQIPDYILKNYSFILYKNNTVAAYSILSVRNADTLEFDQLAASKQFRSTGLAIFPGLCSFEAAYHDGKYQKLMWQIMGGNTACSDMLSQMLSCKKTQMRIDTFSLINGHKKVD